MVFSEACKLQFLGAGASDSAALCRGHVSGGGSQRAGVACCNALDVQGCASAGAAAGGAPRPRQTALTCIIIAILGLVGYIIISGGA